MEIGNFPFLDGDVSRSPSYGVYILQLIRFVRVCSYVDDFNNRNNSLASKLLKQGYRYLKNFVKLFFSKFYYRHLELIVKYTICLKTFCNYTGCIILITGVLIACLGMLLAHTTFMIRT